MSGILRFITGGPPVPRQQKRDSRELYAERQRDLYEMTAFEMELDSFITRRTMDYVADLHEYRKFKAKGDEELDEHLRWLEAAYVARQGKRLGSDQ